MKSWFLILFLLVGICWSLQVQLPADGFYPGWKKSGKTRYFRGTELFNHIDGGAELFLEFGFVDLTVQHYRNNSLEIGLEVYQMENAEAALGIYLFKCGKEQKLPQLNIRHSYNRLQLMAVKGRYFCVVNRFGGEENLAAVMAQLVSMTLADVPNEDATYLFAFLPQEHLLAGSERLIRGPYGLQSIYTFGEDDILQLNRQVFAVVGDYSHENDNYTQIQALYPTSTSAAKAWSYLVENLDPTLQIINQNGFSIIFQDDKGEYGKIQLLGTHISIAIHLANKPEF